jgi:hypothetical protein
MVAEVLSYFLLNDFEAFKSRAGASGAALRIAGGSGVFLALYVVALVTFHGGTIPLRGILTIARDMFGSERIKQRAVS